VHESILIRGARVHNLKNISCAIPRNSLTVITGVSGSGKSSLAFDTIYAEGQRRYVESLSAYARQFLERMDKPDVDAIEGIGPAMAIEQKTNIRNPRSTVGTTTEVYDYLRVLFARIGTTFCRQCGKPVTRDSVATVRAALEVAFVEASARGEDLSRGLRYHVSFPLPLHPPKETLSQAIQNLQKEGFIRVVVGDRVIDTTTETLPPRTKGAEVAVLVDRLLYRSGEENERLADAVETAFAAGSGKATVTLLGSGTLLRFDQSFACAQCHITYQEPDPRLFSFNNPFGACPECQGFGRAVGIDMAKVVPDPGRTLREGAIQPWTTTKFKEHLRALLRVARDAGVRCDIPFRELSPKEIQILLDGYGEFGGINTFFTMLEKKAYKIYYRVLLSRYRGYTTCPTCKGTRLRTEALDVKIGGRSIAELVALTVAESRRFVGELQLTPYEHSVARRVLGELQKRLEYLDEVGIGYLTLDRLSSTLSGGESQRINLATCLGSSLAGAVYVLDEPSIGLHPRDHGRLIRILKALRDGGNTVIVVEHDADMMRASDAIIDLGPRAGEQGGEVIYSGSRDGILKERRSLTGEYLSGRRGIPVPPRRRDTGGYALVIHGAGEHNLKGIDVRIPLHAFVCVTGVSGSGKSTLVHDVLYGNLRKALGDHSAQPGRCIGIDGTQLLSAVEMVDQSPIGRTPRSNPVTYIGVFDQIRAIFAATPAAKVHGMKPGAFSFNVPGGRCEACEGDGVVRVEMQFLADLFLPCDSCKGKRYKNEVLDVRYRGKNIDDVLSMTVAEAIAFFDQDVMGRKVSDRLRVLHEVGLGYIRLGQPATSLSGGEAQRIKLAAHLGVSHRERNTLFIFDEPTTGLHVDDIARLIESFDALIAAGNSVLVIEHNVEVIKCADHLIDLGPEAGEEGGRIVAEGTPEEIVAVTASHTGRALAPLLPPGGRRKGRSAEG
jgi:excinuclease ABC subunit A